MDLNRTALSAREAAARAKRLARIAPKDVSGRLNDVAKELEQEADEIDRKIAKSRDLRP